LISTPIDDNAILLTGATGFVGQYLLLDLLDSGRQVVVLARNRQAQPAAQRIELILQHWERNSNRLIRRPRVVSADLREDSNSISNEDSDWISRHVGIVLHSAASVRFDLDERNGEPIATNQEGTKRLVSFAVQHSIPHFHHISTAYTAGNRTGRVYESDLDVGQKLNNAYEESKFNAEVYLHSQRKQFQSLTVHRPSIVVGDSQTGFAPSFHTVYALLRFARALNIERSFEQAFFELIHLTGNERKNLVMVDWLSREIVNVVNRPSHWGRTFHWTHPNPVCGRTLFHSICDSVEACWSDWETIGRWIPKLDISSAVDAHLDTYREYFRDDPIFDRTNAESCERQSPPPIEHADLVKLFSYAIKQRLQSFVYRPDLNRREEISSPRFATARESVRPTNVPVDFVKLEISGENGGQWIVDLAGNVQTESNLPIAKVHVSGWAWADLVGKRNSVESLLRLGRILICGPDYIRPQIAGLIDRLARGHVSSSPQGSEISGGRIGPVAGGATHE
jgi:thioester reductase-like protein